MKVVYCKNYKYQLCIALYAILSAPGCYKWGAVQWLRGSRHKIQPLLWPPPQTPQVIRDPLAAPRYDHP